MKRITLLCNIALIVLVLTAPFVIRHGLTKQEAIERARAGQ